MKNYLENILTKPENKISLDSISLNKQNKDIYGINDFTWLCLKELLNKSNKFEYKNNLFDFLQSDKTIDFMLVNGYALINDDESDLEINKIEVNRALNEALDIIIVNEYIDTYYKVLKTKVLDNLDVCKREIEFDFLYKVSNIDSLEDRDIIMYRVNKLNNDYLEKYVDKKEEIKQSFFDDVKQDFKKSMNNMDIVNNKDEFIDIVNNFK